MIGAPFFGQDAGPNRNRGTAYAFTRSGSVWTQHAQLLAADGAPLDEFGERVAISGGTAVIGAYGDDVGTNGNQGSAYVFSFPGLTSQLTITPEQPYRLQQEFDLAVDVRNESPVSPSEVRIEGEQPGSSGISVSCGPDFDILEGPTPSGPVTLQPGASQVFRYRCRAKTAGEGEVTAQVRGSSADGATRAKATAPLEIELRGDLLIKLGEEPAAAFAIDDAYQRVVSGTQSRKVEIAPVDQKRVFEIKVQNDESVPLAMRLSALETGTTAIPAKYYAAGSDVSAQITSSGWTTPELAAGESVIVRLEFGPAKGAVEGDFRAAKFSLSPATGSGVLDTVRAEVAVPRRLVVNMTADTPDADPDDGVPDVDLDKDGLQTTLRCAIEYVNGRTGEQLIEFDIPADDPGMSNGVALIKPQTPLPAISRTVTIDGSTQNPASATPPIQLDGADLPRQGPGRVEFTSHDEFDSFTIRFTGDKSGLLITADGCKVRGLAVVRFPSYGLDIRGSKTVVQGCHIGIDDTGRIGSANGVGGLQEHFNFEFWKPAPLGGGVILRSSFNQIGGTSPRDRNVISGTSGVSTGGGGAGDFKPSDVTSLGLIIAGAGSNGNIVVGNYFGLDSSGEAVPRVGEGSFEDSFAFCDVLIFHGSGNQIGGTEPGSGNSFAHRGTGVKVSGAVAIGNVIQGNRFGSSVSGSKNLGKTTAIFVVAAQHTQITDNRISARDGDGTDPDLRDGILVVSSASKTLLAANQITNTDSGIELSGDYYSTGPTLVPADNTIEDNEISFSRRNAVLIRSGRDLTIKGNSFHDSRFAAVQLGEHVGVFGGGEPYVSGIQITRNRIYGNGGLGISLSDPTLNGRRNQETPTLNDFGDHDTGPNLRQNFPLLGAAMTQGGGVRVEGTLDTNLGERPYEIEFFANGVSSPTGHGEGERYLGSVTTTTSFAGRAAFSFSTNLEVQPGEWISATATDPDGNTSEFSSVRLVRTGNDPDRDGVDNEVEDRVPNRGARPVMGDQREGTALSNVNSPNTGLGDGNGDGIPDSQQASVASFRTITGHWVTLVSPASTTIENVEPSGAPEFATIPPGSGFPLGFVNFTVGGLLSGGSVAVTGIFHDPLRFTTAFSYGPLHGVSQPQWYEFKDDGSTGMSFAGGDAISLRFVDAARGDHDGQANGRITTTLGPASLVKLNALAKGTGGRMVLQGAGLPGATYAIEASEDVSGPFEPIGSVTADSAGLIQYEDLEAASFARRFYRIAP